MTSQICNTIKEQIIDDNYIKAYNLLQESFICSDMAYINICVNGNIVKAFIDTGAQMSIISRSVALACNIDYLIDNNEVQHVYQKNHYYEFHFFDLNLYFHFLVIQ